MLRAGLSPFIILVGFQACQDVFHALSGVQQLLAHLSPQDQPKSSKGHEHPAQWLMRAHQNEQSGAYCNAMWLMTTFVATFHVVPANRSMLLVCICRLTHDTANL